MDLTSARTAVWLLARWVVGLTAARFTVWLLLAASDLTLLLRDAEDCLTAFVLRLAEDALTALELLLEEDCLTALLLRFAAEPFDLVVL